MENIYLETLGCSKNQVDSEKMLSLLSENGFIIVDDPDKADCIIINTCSFITKAKEEAIETILELANYKKEGRCRKIVVAGCFAQRYPEAIRDEINEVDLIFGVGDISQIVAAVKGEELLVKPEYSEDTLIKRKISGYPGTAYLRVSDGCSNNCSYCAIPLIRGPLRSRKEDSILKEFSFLLDEKVNEIILIGQDTSNYGVDRSEGQQLGRLITDLDRLLTEKSGREVERWLRVLYMHPDHINERLLEELSKCSHFVPYFDIPFQSGSEAILKRMGRSGSAQRYLELLAMIRNYFPNAVFRSTFITGFPGEEERHFEETLNFIREARLDWVGGFTYSEEEDTAALSFDGQVDEAEKEGRLDRIVELSEQLSREGLKRFIGTRQKVIIEEKVEGEELFIGRFYGQAPDVDGLTVVDSFEAEPGRIIEVEIKELNGNDFFAVGDL